MGCLCPKTLNPTSADLESSSQSSSSEVVDVSKINHKSPLLPTLTKKNSHLIYATKTSNSKKITVEDFEIKKA